jgi:hypothetical protein
MTTALAHGGRFDRTSNKHPRLDGIRKPYEQALVPKELVVLEGSAHAQFVFQTDQAQPLTRDIVGFLSAP